VQSLKAVPLGPDAQASAYSWTSQPTSKIIRPNFNPESVLSLSTSFGRAQVVRHIVAEHRDIFVKGLEHLPNDHRYYEIAQNQLGGQFSHYYLLLRDREGCVRVIQPFLIADQDIMAGLPGMVRKFVSQVCGRALNTLKLRMLMVGCSAGEGHLALDVRSGDTKWRAESLGESLQAVAQEMGASLIVFKDFPRIYREQLGGLSRYGYTRTPSMPGSKLELSFKSFEDYLKTKLSHKTRKNLRGKFRKVAETSPLEMEVRTDISAQVDELLPLYRQVLGKSQYKFEELTRDYFVDLGQEMGDRTLFFIWRQNGKAVAFCSCMGHEGVLRDNYIGLDYEVALDCHLYFVTFRDMLTWALENDYHTYYSAPLNYEPKYHLRHDLVPLDLYVKATSGWLNPFLKILLPYLEPTRYDLTLRKFANAADLW